jgi:cytochrome P450
MAIRTADSVIRRYNNRRTALKSPVMSTESPFPGPRPRFPGDILYHFQRHPLQFLSQSAQRYGDIAFFSIGRHRRFYLLSHPDHIREVLVTHAQHFTKSPVLRAAKITLGEGLLTSEGELHTRQRRIMQPIFHPRFVETYAPEMVRLAERARSRWQPDETLDLAEEMTRLTLEVVAKTLFDADIESEVDEIGRAMAVTVTMFDRARSPFAPILNRLPLPSNFRFKRALQRVKGLVERMIEARKSNPTPRRDLLSVLLAARDPEGDHAGMSDTQLRDEAITLFSAGHETTANALVWTYYLLAHYPDIESRLHAELDTVLGRRLPTADDLPRLVFTRAVLAESMRVFPPAWIISRQCATRCTIGPLEVEPGDILLMSQYVVHRDPRWWPDPTRFSPDRFLADSASDRPRYAYFPFGGGPRSCIGEAFAWTEATLLLATLSQNWRLRLVDRHPPLLHATITLRPRHPIRIRPEPRPR